jgi:hypothetical protein
MAEKKFFVDINLQGSALTNATVGTNSSMTKAGSFRYNEGRLEYYDGVLNSIQEVANLRDIEAVTGGLIFQGGYDPTTDTPDITNGDAYKGFFWAATTAGTFLGESVQVGDSIVAKVDGAGANAADWLILQGNIVIATDSVDGISRLATQTEANDGTEAGAVVITPATLQGKIDAQITPEISNKLPLAGGTMLGDIDMDGNSIYSTTIFNSSLATNLDAYNNSIINLPAPTNGGDAANKTYVDDNTSDKLPLAGGTMTGSIDMGVNPIENVSYINGDAININSINGTGAQPEGVRLYGSLKSMYGATITDLPAPNNDGDVANKLYVDGAASTAQTNAQAYADSLAPNYDAAGSAATAESNANDYTDAQSHTSYVQIADWTENAGVYEAAITLPFATDTEFYQITCYDNSTSEVIELYARKSGEKTVTVKSNILPSVSIAIAVSKVTD